MLALLLLFLLSHVPFSLAFRLFRASFVCSFVRFKMLPTLNISLSLMGFGFVFIFSTPFFLNLCRFYLAFIRCFYHSFRVLFLFILLQNKTTTSTSARNFIYNKKKNLLYVCCVCGCCALCMFVVRSSPCMYVCPVSHAAFFVI